jgi:hypothetical protein
MAKRGRPPGGEYPDKREVANFRIRPDTKRLLAAAARKSGRAVSQETEFQLRRALVDKGGPTHAVIGAISMAIDGLLAGTPAADEWLKDEESFDRVVDWFVAALALFRPSAKSRLVEDALRTPHRNNPSTQRPRLLIDTNLALEIHREMISLMTQIGAADLSAPLAAQSLRQLCSQSCRATSMFTWCAPPFIPRRSAPSAADR